MTDRRGLTLVELLAALAISCSLAAAALSVTAGVSRSGRLAQQAECESNLEAHLRGLLAGDVLHADSCRNTPAGMALRTFSALDAGSLELSHLPVTVFYEVRRGEAGVLVRRQQSPAGGAASELVCAGVKSIVVTTGEKQADGWSGMPRLVAVAIEFEDPAGPPMKLTWLTGQR